MTTQEHADSLRRRAYVLIQQIFNVPDGFQNKALNDLVDCIIGAAVLEMKSQNEKEKK